MNANSLIDSLSDDLEYPRRTWCTQRSRHPHYCCEALAAIQMFRIRRQNSRPRRIADANLKLPILCPVFRLFVLADLQQDSVRSGLQQHRRPVLVHPRRQMIFLVGEHQLSVDPQLPAIRRSEPNLNRLCAVGFEFPIGVSNRALMTERSTCSNPESHVARSDSFLIHDTSPTVPAYFFCRSISVSGG